jgi:hypothetical protein
VGCFDESYIADGQLINCLLISSASEHLYRSTQGSGITELNWKVRLLQDKNRAGLSFSVHYSRKSVRYFPATRSTPYLVLLLFTSPPFLVLLESPQQQLVRNQFTKLSKQRFMCIGKASIGRLVSVPSADPRTICAVYLR